MSDNTDISDGPESDDLLAAELSLGLLSGDEASQAARRARIDPVFAALVADWDMRFAEMTDTIAPVTPPKGLFRKVANDAYPDSAKRLWRQLGVIPALLCAGGAALVLILSIEFGGLMPPTLPNPTYVAQIVADDNSLVVAAAYVDDGGRLFVERKIGASAPNRVFELWLIAGDDAPVSLGVLAADETINEVIIPQNLRDRLVGAVLAISDEPAGGSSTGAPPGAVLAIGDITAL